MTALNKRFRQKSIIAGEKGSSNSFTEQQKLKEEVVRKKEEEAWRLKEEAKKLVAKEAQTKREEEEQIQRE